MSYRTSFLFISFALSSCLVTAMPQDHPHAWLREQIEHVLANNGDLNAPIIEECDGYQARHDPPILTMTMTQNPENAAMLEKLLQNGVDPNSCAKYTGNTCLHSASVFKNALGIRILNKYGADQNIKNHKGHTPLLNLIKNFSVAKDIVHALLVHKANPNAYDRQTGDTVLMCALQRMSFYQKRSLQELRPQEKDALIKTCEKYQEIIQMLLLYGAHSLMKNNAGKTAIDSAQENGLDDLADCLKKHQKDMADRLASFLCGKPEKENEPSLANLPPEVLCMIAKMRYDDSC